MTAIRLFLARAWSLAGSRRVLVALVVATLVAARWRLLGPMTAAELGAVLSPLVAWVLAESWRRHEGPLAESGRLVTLIAGLLGALGAGVLARVGVELPAELVVAWSGVAAALIVGQAPRGHPAGGGGDAEDAPGPGR